MSPGQALTPILHLKKDQISFADAASAVKARESSFIAASDEQGQFPIV
jgi:hypothetical protein